MHFLRHVLVLSLFSSYNVIKLLFLLVIIYKQQFLHSDWLSNMSNNSKTVQKVKLAVQKVKVAAQNVKLAVRNDEFEND